MSSGNTVVRMISEASETILRFVSSNLTEKKQPDVFVGAFFFFFPSISPPDDCVD